MNEKNPKSPEVRPKIRYHGNLPEDNPFIYFNNIEINTSGFDITVKLNRIVGVDEKKNEVVMVNLGTLAMSPQQAVSFADLLGKSVQNFFASQQKAKDGATNEA